MPFVFALRLLNIRNVGCCDITVHVGVGHTRLPVTAKSVLDAHVAFCYLGSFTAVLLALGCLAVP